jgi:hypothetical protein
VWLGTPTGTFTTRSAYQLMVDDNNRVTGSSSNPMRLNAFWNGIWRANVPHKIRVFMWRACSSILPTKTNLFKRGIVSSSTCPTCQDGAESVLHILWDCAYAKECWQNSPLSHLCTLPRPSSWNDLVELVLRKEVSPVKEIFFVLAWMIWGCRNDAWLKKPQLEASMTGPKAVTYVEEYLEANKRVDSTRPFTKNKWLPPPNDCVKLNVAWQRFKESKTYGVGSVIWDYTGALLAAHCEILPQVGDNLTMAATSMQIALKICQEAGFQSVIVEFSHPQLKALILSKTTCLTEIDDHISCIRSFSSLFCSLAFHVIPSSCNKAAKVLARYAKETTEPSIWLEEGPAVLLPIVITELS